MEFVGHFRQVYSCLQKSPGGFTDTWEILSSIPELKSCPNLYQLFRLSCFCLTEDTPLLPPIRFQDVDSQSLKCRLVDVLLPSQSYLARVPDAITVCTNEDSIVKFRELVEQFNSGNVAGGPWTHVDTLGRNHFFKTLHAKYQSIVHESKSASSSRSASGSSSPTGSIQRKKSGKQKRKVAFGTTQSATEEIVPGVSDPSTSKL